MFVDENEKAIQYIFIALACGYDELKETPGSEAFKETVKVLWQELCAKQRS